MQQDATLKNKNHNLCGLNNKGNLLISLMNNGVEGTYCAME
jgi:hypothetical protein